MTESKEVDLGLLLTPDEDLEKEDRCFRKSVKYGKIEGDILSTCNFCNTENNLTENKSTFCQKCGMLLTERHGRDSNRKKSAK